MKKLLLKFADEVLSREELKSVRGASSCGRCYGPYGYATCTPIGYGACMCAIGSDRSCDRKTY